MWSAKTLNLISYDSPASSELRLNKPDVKAPVFDKPETAPNKLGNKLFGTPVLKKPDISPATLISPLPRPCFQSPTQCRLIRRR